MDNTDKIGGDMPLINGLARRELNEDEVYIFPVVLCDNETDRDCERFSQKALERLAELFVGKTGIFDHDPKGKNQTARIYSAEVTCDPERTTSSGEVYRCVRAKAYMMRTGSNADFIREIDGGIKKEVSVSCAVGKKICSICGADVNKKPCQHAKGKMYSGKLCEHILDEPTDAYEWSFVAIPAQPAAGITKAMSGGGYAAEVKALKRELREKYCELSDARGDIISEIIRLGQFCVPAYAADTVKRACAGMSIPQLISFKEQTRSQVRCGRSKSVLYAENESESSNRNKNSFGGFKIGK